MQQLRLVALIDHRAVAGRTGVGGIHGLVNVAARYAGL